MATEIKVVAVGIEIEIMTARGKVLGTESEHPIVTETVTEDLRAGGDRANEGPVTGRQMVGKGSRKSGRNSGRPSSGQPRPATRTGRARNSPWAAGPSSPDAPESNALKVHIHHLRKALTQANANVQLLSRPNSGFYLPTEPAHG